MPAELAERVGTGMIKSSVSPESAAGCIITETHSKIASGIVPWNWNAESILDKAKVWDFPILTALCFEWWVWYCHYCKMQVNWPVCEHIAHPILTAKVGATQAHWRRHTEDSTASGCKCKRDKIEWAITHLQYSPWMKGWMFLLSTSLYGGGPIQWRNLNSSEWCNLHLQPAQLLPKKMVLVSRAFASGSPVAGSASLLTNFKDARERWSCILTWCLSCEWNVYDTSGISWEGQDRNDKVLCQPRVSCKLHNNGDSLQNSIRHCPMKLKCQERTWWGQGLRFPNSNSIVLWTTSVILSLL